MKRIFFGLLITLTQVTFGQDTKTSFQTNTTIQYQINPTNLQIGKPFVVSYKMPSDIVAILSIDSNIQIQADMDIVLTNLSQNTFDIEAVSYSPIPHSMPSFLLSVLLQNGETNHIYTPSFELFITNKIAEEKELSMIDIEEPYFVFDFLWLIILLIIILIIVGVYLFNKYRKSATIVNKKEEIDPFAMMETKLNELKSRQLSLTEENYKEFFVDLSETVREFLSHTIIPLALETPTRELLKTLKDLKTDSELFDIISFIMRSTDRAKYAKQIFTQDRIEDVVKSSEQLLLLLKARQQQEQEYELRKS